MPPKGNAKMDGRIEAFEKLMEEQGSRLTNLEAMMKKLCKAWEKRFPGTESLETSPEGEKEPTVDTFYKNKWRRLEIPIFEGGDAFGWISKLERYFRMRKVANEEKMDAILVALDGEALGWFQWWESCNSNPTWEEFKAATIQRFQPAAMSSLFQSLLSLWQEKTVNDFVTKFEKYAGAVHGIDERYLLEVFVTGLKEEVGAELRLHEPMKLTEAMFKERQIEEKNVAVGKGNDGLHNKSYNAGRSYGGTRFTRDWQPSSSKATDKNSSGAQSPVNKNLGGAMGKSTY